MKNRIVIVQNSLKTVAVFRQYYIKELISEGFSVIVIAPNDCDASKSLLQSLGAQICDISKNTNKLNLISTILEMNLAVLKYRGKDVTFICHFAVTFLFCYFSLIPFNSKCIVYIEGLGSIFSHENFVRRVFKLLLNKNAAVRLFCNNDDKNMVGSLNDIVTGGIGIDIKKFNSKNKSISDGDTYNLLYVGRLIKDKGATDSIVILRELLARGVNVKLNLVGDVYPANPTSLTDIDIIKFKREFGTAINFAGYSNAISEWYLKSDILVLPSKREGFPVCVMESSAMGLPSICYNVPGCSDAVKSGVNGELITLGDINEYCDVIEKTLNPKILSEFKLSCENYALDNFNAITKTADLVNVIRAL